MKNTNKKHIKQMKNTNKLNEKNSLFTSLNLLQHQILNAIELISITFQL